MTEPGDALCMAATYLPSCRETCPSFERVVAFRQAALDVFKLGRFVWYVACHRTDEATIESPIRWF